MQLRTCWVGVFATLVLISTMAAGSSVKSGTTKGSGSTEIEACEDAKKKAHLNHCPYGTEDKRVGECRCGKTATGFECIVDYKDFCRDKDNARRKTSGASSWVVPPPGGPQETSEPDGGTKKDPTLDETLAWIKKTVAQYGSGSPSKNPNHEITQIVDGTCARFTVDWERKFALPGPVTKQYEGKKQVSMYGDLYVYQFEYKYVATEAKWTDRHEFALSDLIRITEWSGETDYNLSWGIKLTTRKDRTVLTTKPLYHWVVYRRHCKQGKYGAWDCGPWEQQESYWSQEPGGSENPNREKDTPKVEKKDVASIALDREELIPRLTSAFRHVAALCSPTRKRENEPFLERQSVSSLENQAARAASKR